MLGNHLDVFYQLIQYSQTLLDNSEVVVLHEEMPASVKSEWTKMLETVQKINKKRQSDEKIGENHAFELLFLHVGLQLFTEPDGAIESLQVSVSLLFELLFLHVGLQLFTETDSAIESLQVCVFYESCGKKPCLWGFRQGPTQTVLYSLMRWLEA